MLAGDVNRLSIGREYGFHSSTGRELSPLGSRERKLSLYILDKKVQSLSTFDIFEETAISAWKNSGIVSKGLTGDRKSRI
jgi:hypothetical protein